MPERWLSHMTKDATCTADSRLAHVPTDKAQQYLPFSNGPRNCVAQVRLKRRTHCAIARLLGVIALRSRLSIACASDISSSADFVHVWEGDGNDGA